MSVGRKAVYVLAAIATLWGVGGIFHLAVGALRPHVEHEFHNTNLFRPWPLWTSKYMAIHPLWFGVVFASVYLWLRSRGGIRPGIREGSIYGAGVFVVGSLPVYVLAFASFAVILEVIFWWIVQSALQYITAGAVMGWISQNDEPGRSTSTQ